jgi:hypothetical protein
MQISERELEDLIYNTIKQPGGFEKLDKKGLDVVGDVYRQVNIPPYGIIDLLSVDIDTAGDNDRLCINVDIYELKIIPLKYEHLGQVFRYKTAIERLIRNINDYRFNYMVRCTLIVPQIDNNDDIVFLLNGLSQLGFRIYTYEYTIDGIEFNQDGCGWYNKGEDFSKIDVSPVKKGLWIKYREFLRNHAKFIAYIRSRDNAI